ncbi:MAG: cation diffusion facilitator family transporter [bacterium]
MVHQHQPNIRSNDTFQVYQHTKKWKLIFTISITLIVMIIEVVGGYWIHSIALISDAGHMFTHLFALGIGYAAIVCMSFKSCHHRTYGFYRAEILAALFNSLFLFGVTIFICYESIRRLLRPHEILSWQMFSIALLGLIVNLISIWILHGAHHQDDRNIRGIVLHMFADAGSSAAIVIGAIIMSFTGWYIIDPIISIGIAVLIAVWAWDLFKDSINVLLETAPKGITTDEVAKRIEQEISEVINVEDIHIWEITTHMFSMTAHILIKDISVKDTALIREKINKLVYDQYEIGHTTIQFRS